jgi:hypothetical protein
MCYRIAASLATLALSSGALCLPLATFSKAARWYRVERENRYWAQLEATCHFAAGASDYIGQSVCLRGPVREVVTEPSFRATFGFADPVTYALFFDSLVVVTSEEYTVEGLKPGSCIHVWGTVVLLPDGSIQLELDPSRPVMVSTRPDC